MLINEASMNNLNWIRNMRKKQGLKGFQLAERMQVSAARISVLEKDESRGAVTLKMMERAAKAMGCKFEYRIVPLNENTNTDLKSSKPRYRVVER
jgi:transcriptional regulator with XRE-family HTH domain